VAQAALLFCYKNCFCYSLQNYLPVWLHVAELSVAAAVSSVLHLEHPVGRVAAVVAESIPTNEPVVGAECSIDPGDDGSNIFGPEPPGELLLVNLDLEAKEFEVNLVNPVVVPHPPVLSTFAQVVLQDFLEDHFLGNAVGSVHYRMGFWKNMLEADSYVLDIVEKGYKIPVCPGTENISYRERNNGSTRREQDFVQVEVARLLAAGLVVKSASQPLCCNSLSVAFKQKVDGTMKQRLVIDLLRHVNCLIPDSKYCMTPLGDVLSQTDGQLPVCL
jgi:hypothetical protein